MLYRRRPVLEVLCAHMGGPLWARKDEHAWSFPKGVIEDGEDELTAARREFAEEIGIPAPDEPYRRLGEYRYSSGKLVVLFAAEADLVVDEIRGGTFELDQWDTTPDPATIQRIVNAQKRFFESFRCTA